MSTTGRMSSSVHRKASTIARHSAELALAVPEVMAHRLTRIYLSGGNPSWRQSAELQRMTSEKIIAFWLAWNGMAAELARAYLRLALLPISSPVSMSWNGLHHSLAAQTAHATAAVVAAGLAPIHRRATANARRLRRSGKYQ